MENLRAYAEDEAQAPSVQTPVTKGPNTSEGLSASSSTSSTSASVPSTRTLSGPVQEVSAPLQSSSVVSRDKTVSLKDIPPPPPPDEPYELFLARVACQTLDPAGGTPRRQACSAAITANYGGPPPTYTFPKIWGHHLGIHSSSSGAQDSYALTSIVLRASSSTLDLVRMGPGRTSSTGP